MLGFFHGEYHAPPTTAIFKKGNLVWPGTGAKSDLPWGGKPIHSVSTFSAWHRIKVFAWSIFFSTVMASAVCCVEIPRMPHIEASTTPIKKGLRAFFVISPPSQVMSPSKVLRTKSDKILESLFGEEEIDRKNNRPTSARTLWSWARCVRLSLKQASKKINIYLPQNWPSRHPEMVILRSLVPAPKIPTPVCV